MQRWLEFLAARLRQAPPVANALIGIALFLVMAGLVVLIYPLVVWTRGTYGINLALAVFVLCGALELLLASLFSAAVRVNREHLEEFKRKKGSA